MKENREQEEKTEKEEPEIKNTDEDNGLLDGFGIDHFIPVFALALVTATELLFFKESVTGAVRNFIVAGVMAFATMFTCRKNVTPRISLLITVLGILASVQAFIPDFLVPIAGFAVVIAVLASSSYLGVSCLMLFSAIPFLITERSFEYFLFYAVTGMIAIALIYGRRKTGVFTDVIVVFILVYVLLYTGLIILKRLSLTPGLIIAPIVMLILDVVIMKITGYRYYTDVVKVEEELYLNVVDPEYPLLMKLKSMNKREYKRAIHTAHFTELFANKFGYDPVLMKGLGFYHRIGVLLEDDASLNMRTIALVIEQGFPDDIVNVLKEYGDAVSGERISAEVSITIIVDTVIDRLMEEYSKGFVDIDLNKFIDRTILSLFSGKDSLLKKSAIPYSDLEDIRKHLKGEKLYYGFLR